MRVCTIGSGETCNVLQQRTKQRTYVRNVCWRGLELCVPDVTLDVDSDNPLRYHAQNQGADILETIMSNVGLTDERREQLGMEAEYTHKQKTAPPGRQKVTSTRLDR